jgi:mono/diheme cytochrome c family protein
LPTGADPSEESPSADADEPQAGEGSSLALRPQSTGAGAEDDPGIEATSSADPGDGDPPPDEESAGADPAGRRPDDDAIDAGDEAALAASAEEVLRTTCYRCHGQEGVAEGGFNFVLSRERLVAGDTYVVPGKAADSYLLSRIEANEMPPAGDEPRPTQAQVALLRRWIDAGAPDFAPQEEREFISNALVLKFIRQDLEKTVPPRDHRYTRYYTLTHLYNAGFSTDELTTYRLALAKLINSLSWGRTIKIPQAIDPAETIYRIDMRDFQWDEELWKAIVSANPYGVMVDSPDGKFVRQATESQLPDIRGDWFVAAASRPPLYHRLLQLPATVPELEKVLRIDAAANIAQEKVVRAGFGDSGVSHNNRLIERHDSPYGAYWISYDFDGNTGRKDLHQHPLGPGQGDEHFEHAGGEIIFNLPNGLQGYMLADGAGHQLDKGPTSIVSDPKRPDRAVTNGVSCMSCHFRGVIVKQDTIRAHVETNRASFPNADDILALYPPQENLDRLFAEDADRFKAAVEQVGLKELTSTGEPVVNMALRFESDVDLPLASAELGLAAQEFSDGLAQFPQLARGLGPLRVPGGRIKRETFVALFAEAVTEFGLGTPLAVPDPSTAATASTSPAVDQAETPAPATASAPPANPNVRLWQDATGKFKVEGELIALNLGKVSIRKSDGTIAAVALDRLSQADQDFVLGQPAKAVDLPPGEALPSDLPPGAAPPPDLASVPGQPPVRPSAGPKPPRKGDFRPWYDELGGREYVAEFLGLRNGMVRIMQQNGIVLYLPLLGLSKVDHEFVRTRVGPAHFKRHSQAPDLKFPPLGAP